MQAEADNITKWLINANKSRKAWTNNASMPPHMQKLGYVVPPHLQKRRKAAYSSPNHQKSTIPKHNKTKPSCSSKNKKISSIPIHNQPPFSSQNRNNKIKKPILLNEIRTAPITLHNENMNIDDSASDSDDMQLQTKADVFTVDEYGIHVSTQTKTIRFWNPHSRGYETLLKSTTLNNNKNKFESKFNTKITVKANGGAADFNKWYNIFGVDLMQHNKNEIGKYFPKESDDMEWSPLEAILQFKKAVILDVLPNLLKK